MSAHLFDSEIALKVGVNAAVIYQNIVFWCEKNAANGKHIHDGMAWTYNSVRAFSEMFPYLTQDQIRRAIERLEAGGLIATGNFNEDSRDRTKWFCDLRQTHLASMPETFGVNAKALPDSKPDGKPDGKQRACENGLFSADETPQQDRTADAFERFWKVYPKKAAKPAALKAWQKQIKAGHDQETIIDAAARYAQSDNVSKGFVKHAQGWLNDQRWNDDDLPQPAKPMTLEERARRLGPQWGEVER